MILRNRRGQALIEALVAAVFIMGLASVVGFAALAPLAVFFAEDQMEEALQCATYQPAVRCEHLLNQQLQTGILRRWFARGSVQCTWTRCYAITQWRWPAPFPARLQRELAKDLSRR